MQTATKVAVALLTDKAIHAKLDRVSTCIHVLHGMTSSRGHFMRYVMRPLLRSYGVISILTLSPVRMRM